ncbi:UbiA prenyltransferase family protein [Zeaxanthinibacter enoshimensis]|uniref:UbiA prenyltransferase family protein n=1 Tax=Zeaxanthinibacter enoshimensis TaxID=392009 RepID=A0A4R6TJM2_9FLAO|nr:hypothetical protein [Zeaxanthinibacter enoshimensis]TDQ28962.1 hypothetical protein CLV82_2411 [Zeaxanthinibacter enoshimensis]
MRALKQSLDFYLDASVHVALSVVALIDITARFFNLGQDEHLSYFMFFATIVCYNFIKYGIEARKYFFVSNSYHRYIQVFSFIAGIFGAYHAYFLEREVWITLVLLTVLIGLYALPVLPHARNLRNLGILKVLMVAFVWAGVTVILPVVSSGLPLGWDIQVEAGQRMIVILVLMIPFEIRDMFIDQPALKTLPQRLGVRGSRWLGILLSVIFVLATFFKDAYTATELYSKIIFAVLLVLVMWLTREKQSEYFASFWVELTPLVWWAILLILGQLI